MVTIDGLLAILAATVLVVWVSSGSAYVSLQPYIENIEWPHLHDLQYKFAVLNNSCHVTIYIKVITFRLSHFSPGLATSQHPNSSGDVLKLLVEIESPRIRLVPFQPPKGRPDDPKPYDSQPENRSPTLDAVLKYVGGSPTCNRFLSFILRRVAVEITDTILNLDGQGTLVTGKMSLSQSKVYLRTTGNTMENDMYHDDHKESLKLSKSFTTFNLRRGHAARLIMDRLQLISDEKVHRADANVLFSVTPLQLTASTTIPRQHNEKHRVSFAVESNTLQAKLDELSSVVMGLKGGNISSEGTNSESADWVDFLDGIHMKLDHGNVSWTPRVQSVLESIYLSASCTSTTHEEEKEGGGGPKLALSTSEVSMIWCEPNRDSFKLLYSKSLQLNISRSVNVTPNESSSSTTVGYLPTCTNVGVNLDQPAVTISYDVLYPLKAEILDICQAWDPKQVNKLATDIDVKLPSGRLHTTFSASHPALRIKDANENVITQIDASLFRVTMDTTSVEDFEIHQSYTPDQSFSSDTLVDGYTSSSQSSTHILQRYKTDLCLEVEDLTTWKQCLRYLSEREFTPSACNYFAVDQFCFTYTTSSFSSPGTSISSSILDELPRPSCCLTFGSIHMDVRDAPYFVERAIPWVVLISNLIKNDSPQLVQASTSSKCSPLVRIIIYSVDISFLAIDRPLNQETKIPPQHFCNAPSEDIGCGILFAAADVIVAISSTEDINSIRASSNHLNDVSISAKEISLCYLIDEEGENCVFSLGEEPMLWIPDLSLRCHEERGFPEDVRFGQVVSMELSLIQFCWAPQALYSVLCLAQCTKDTHALFKQMEWGSDNSQSSSQAMFKSLRMSASSRQIVGRFSLSPTMKIQMEVADSSVHILPNHTMLSLGELRFYGTTKHGTVWKRLLFASQLKLNQVGGNESKIIMQTLCFRLPYNYVCATIVEAAIHAWKLTKTLFNRLVKGNVTEWQGPSDRSGPVNVPSIQLRVHQFSVEFEDDPFESRLRLLWKTSLSEQPRRVKTEEAFYDKVNAMFEEREESGSSSNGHKLPDSLRLSAMIADLKSKRNSTEMPSGPKFTSHSVVGKDKSSSDIEATWQRLQEYNSKCWINEVRSAIKQEETATKGQRSAWYQPPFEQPLEEASSSSSFRYRLSHSSHCQHAIDITVDPINPYSPLLGLSVDNLTIDVTSPSFPLNQTTSFIQDVGEGVPLDTAYSVLLPFRMYCSGAKTIISLRDYPLPLLRVPEDRSARREFRTAWTLSGDFVIADELGDVAGAWLKPITLIPERNYTLNLLRVASPLKFFSIVDIEVHTPEVTYIAWSMSVQPAIEDIIRIVDSFTPSPIDPSPKLGFWDKVRLMIHSRTRIRFLGQGDLALWMKGKKDPYSLSADGAGIIKVWQRNVECRLGYTNSENELLQIFSDEYILAVPNVDFDEGRSSNSENESKGMFFIEEPPEYCNDQKYQKTVLSLKNGVRWGLACHFERFCRRGCTQCNTTTLKGNCKLMTFEPHYLVVYRTPEIVKRQYDVNEYDSFEGFRSRWIHLSFTVSNTDYANGQQLSPNALRLTPKFLSHFVDWFSLFGGENGLPIRTGKMFPREDHRPTQKFGKHLGTIRYQIVLNCLFLSHIYKDEESGFEGDFLGFKANVKSFVLDIHQRREHMQKDHHLLGSRSTSKWPMYEGEVIFDTMDVRVILATYLQSQPVSRSEFESSEEATEREWIDQLDYCELGVPAIVLPPITKLLPFVTAPYLSMRKIAKEAEKERSSHLHGVHQCYIGSSPSTSDVQIRLHKERFNVINDHVRKIEVEIVDLEAKIAQNPNDTELLAESLSLLESTALLYEKKRQLNLYLQEMLEGDSNSPSMRSCKSFGGGAMEEWEQLMGFFQVQLVLHNPCIIWNNEIRNVVYRFMDLQDRSKTRNLLLSTKTLRSLVNASNLSAPCANDDPTPIIDNSSSNKNTVYDILESLASADGQQNVALSECDDWIPSVESSPDTVSDMNDPIWQQNSLSADHRIKNNYTLDLLNPQFLFKSAKSTSGILVSAERAHLKGLTIFNKNSRDPDTEYIEERSLCRIDNSQFSIVKNVKTQDLKNTSHDLGGLNTLPWIPLEALVDKNFMSQDYERVASGVSATLQYDDYNKLSMEPSQHPFEENANGVRLHFPAITLTATSVQYNALYDVFKDLLLYSEPAKVDRQASLQEMMFISDLDTLPYVLDAAVLLKDNIRQHREALQQYHQYLSVLTEEQFEQYIALSKSHFELYDELYLLMESVKIAQSDRQSFMKLEAKTSLKFEVIANKVCWKMVLASTSHTFEWDLTHVNFMWLGKEDRSVKYKLELDKIVILHERDDEPIELVGPHYLNDRRYINFSKHKMLQGYLVETASVGGIPVVEHMEIKLAPIKLNMTYDIAKALASYLFPPEKRYQEVNETNEFDPVSVDPDVAYPADINAAEASSIPTTESPKKRRALSLGKLSDFYGRVRRTDWNATAGDDSTIDSTSVDALLNRPRRWSAVNLWWNEISVMRKRASNTRCFIYVKIPGAKHCLTYKGPKNRNFADMNNFVFKQPTIELRNRTCSWYELLDMVKKEILLAAVLHSGSLIKEKILPRGARRPLSWHSQRPGRWAFSQSARSLALSSSSEDSTIEDSEDDARSMISSFSRAEEDVDSTRDLSVGSIQQSSNASRPASMISDTSKKQRWTQRIANKRPKFPNPFSTSLRRRGSQRSNVVPSEVMEKGKLLLGKQYDGPMNRTRTSDSTET